MPLSFIPSLTSLPWSPHFHSSGVKTPFSHSATPCPTSFESHIRPPCCSHLPIPSHSLSFFENFSSGSLSFSPILVLSYVLVISMTLKIILPCTFISLFLGLLFSIDLVLNTTSATLSQSTHCSLCHHQ